MGTYSSEIVSGRERKKHVGEGSKGIGKDMHRGSQRIVGNREKKKGVSKGRNGLFSGRVKRRM